MLGRCPQNDGWVTTTKALPTNNAQVDTRAGRAFLLRLITDSR